MKRLALLLLFAAAPCLAAERRPFPDLTPGRYEVKLDGLLCHTCVKVLLEEVAAVREVEKATADFDKETLTISVGKTLRISRLRKALDRAAKRIDLDSRLEIAAIKYKV